MSKLSPVDHQKVLQLGLDFRRGDDASKQVFIRDELAAIFDKWLLKMRLFCEEVGIHPGNRDTDVITAMGVWLRGSKIIASGFSKAAIGTLYAFEDHPTRQHIAKHTIGVTNTDEFGTFDLATLKVGPANWTHSNQFVNMVKCGTKCSDPDIPCIDGRIDSDAILKDPRNVRLSDYIKEGMYYRVFPYWVEDAYDWLPELFQSASNQEQQVQEGTGFSNVYKSIVFVCSCFFTEDGILRSDRVRSDRNLSGPTRADPIIQDPTYLIQSDRTQSDLDRGCSAFVFKMFFFRFVLV